MTETVPEVEEPVMATSQELRLTGPGGQSRHLLTVTEHDLLEAELQVAGENRVPGGASKS